MTIGIYSNVNDNIYSSPYAFKISMPIVQDEYQLAAQLIQIRRDQKVQCIPTEYRNKTNETIKYICLFAVILDDIDIDNNLIIYPKPRDGYSFTAYGKIVDTEIIEKNEPSEIDDLVTKVLDKEEFKEENNYIYLRNLKKNQSYFFMTVTGNKEMMYVLSSTYVYYSNMTLYPNPNTPQIFAIGDKEINFNFLTTQELLLNIVGISGRGQFYWDDEEGRKKQYYLSGAGERLALTSTTDEVKNKLSNLKVKPMDVSEADKTGGFIFYITYYPRSNIDQIKREKNTEFHYRTVKMPLNYYSQIRLPTSYTINFNFYDLTLKENANLEYDINLFNILGTIINDVQINEARVNLNKIPQYNISNPIKGSFDLAFGTLFISSDHVKKLFNPQSNENKSANLFFSVEQVNNISDISSIGVEVSIYPVNNSYVEYTIPEGVYLNGKISNSPEGKLIYILENKNKSYLKIEFSSLSDSIKFVLSSVPKSEQNDEIKKISLKEEGGRKLLTYKLEKETSSLYLIIYSKETNLNKKLDYFVFKYLYAEKEEDFISFFNKDRSNITIERNHSNYRIMFYPILQFNVSYYIKAVYKNDFIEGENVNSIAISESKGKYMHINDLHFNKSNERVAYDLLVNKEVLYIKILARFNHYNERMFYLYTPYEIKSESEKPASKTGAYIAIGIGCLLVIVVVALILVIYFYNKKHKNLLDQVNKISFSESEGQESTEEDLILNDENELD